VDCLRLRKEHELLSSQRADRLEENGMLRAHLQHLTALNGAGRFENSSTSTLAMVLSAIPGRQAVALIAIPGKRLSSECVDARLRSGRERFRGFLSIEVSLQIHILKSQFSHL
jgi:hypothetical protein